MGYIEMQPRELLSKVDRVQYHGVHDQQVCFAAGVSVAMY